MSLARLSVDVVESCALALNLVLHTLISIRILAINLLRLLLHIFIIQIRLLALRGLLPDGRQSHVFFVSLILPIVVVLRLLLLSVSVAVLSRVCTARLVFFLNRS